VFIVSGASRIDPDRVAERVSAAFDVAQRPLLRIAGSSSEAVELAREAAAIADIVVAVGGDGTVADVATGIFGSAASLGIVPTGSTNITARCLGIPRGTAAAVALIAGPHVRRRIDVGRCDERCFLHIAGAGFDAELFEATSPTLKRSMGWLAYLPAAAAAARLPPARVRVVADDEVIDAISPLVLVANGGSILVPELTLYPDVAIDDGWLDVLVFTAATLAEIAATLGQLGRLALDRSPHVQWRRAKRVGIESSPTMRVQLDGDVRGETPTMFHVAPGGMTVITPQR
jgi:YegS/Rv2252/BmrU family lipid kinase